MLIYLNYFNPQRGLDFTTASTGSYRDLKTLTELRSFLALYTTNVHLVFTLIDKIGALGNTF